MAKLHPLEDSMFPEIFETFLEQDDKLLTRSDWQRLFVNVERAGLRRDGWVLVARNRIVGILGMLRTNRWIQNEYRPFANLHSWYVLPEYRGFSLFLLQKAIADRDLTLTDFTPTRSVTEISQRLGLKLLDSRLRLLLRVSHRKTKRIPRSVTLFTDSEEVLSQLDDAHRQMIVDHEASGCRHLLLRDHKRTCHVSYSRVDRWRIPYCYVHQVSDPELFAQWHALLRERLTAQTQTRFVALDARAFARQEFPWSVTLPIGCSQLFRSNTIHPAFIDSMYSEIVLLSLSTFPDLSASLSAGWRYLRQRAAPGKAATRHEPALRPVSEARA